MECQGIKKDELWKIRIEYGMYLCYMIRIVIHGQHCVVTVKLHNSKTIKLNYDNDL